MQSHGARLGSYSLELIRGVGGCALIGREHNTAPELAFLLVVAAGVIAMVTAELELAFRVFG